MEKPNEWRNKFQEIFQVCSEELKRTTEIGKKMLSASKTNSTLHESYEELGVLAARALKKQELQWDEPKVQEILKRIESCQEDLETIEKQVNDIRFAEEEEKNKSSEN